MSRHDHEPRPGRHRTRTTPLRRAALAVAALVSVASVPVLAGISGAATVNEVTARWVTTFTDAPVPSATTLASAWRFNVNDDGAAPDNEVVPNVVFRATAQNLKFATLPSTCLTEGVTPVSTLDADGRGFTCNIGERREGTAIVLNVAGAANGPDGSTVG